MRQERDANSVLSLYRKAIGIRHGNAALKTGSVEVLEASEDALILRCSSGTETVSCTCNFGTEPLAVQLAGKVLLKSSGGAVLEPRCFDWMRDKI